MHASKLFRREFQLNKPSTCLETVFSFLNRNYYWPIRPDSIFYAAKGLVNLSHSGLVGWIQCVLLAELQLKVVVLFYLAPSSMVFSQARSSNCLQRCLFT